MKKVLIVDDQSFIREVLKSELLNLLDVSVLEAANGNEAMGKMRVSKPDMVLLDIVMPGKDGLELLKEMHDDIELRNVPVIVVSSHAEEEKRSKAKEYGAREFIDKLQLNDINFGDLVKRYLGV